MLFASGGALGGDDGVHQLGVGGWIVEIAAEIVRAFGEPSIGVVLHAAGTITRSGRRTRLRLAARWPWVTHLVAAFEQVRRLGLQT